MYLYLHVRRVLIVPVTGKNNRFHIIFGKGAVSLIMVILVAAYTDNSVFSGTATHLAVWNNGGLWLLSDGSSVSVSVSILVWNTASWSGGGVKYVIIEPRPDWRNNPGYRWDFCFKKHVVQWYPDEQEQWEFFLFFNAKVDAKVGNQDKWTTLIWLISGQGYQMLTWQRYFVFCRRCPAIWMGQGMY